MDLLPVIVPSWVIPGSPAANAAFLRGRVRGVMLCCFEHAPRLPMELPPASFGLEWHIHLPVDLPWDQGGEAAGRSACRTMDEAAHLLGACSRAVLHVPSSPSLLAGFLHAWCGAGHAEHTLLLENVPDSTLNGVFPPQTHNMRLCLDAAHLALSCTVAQAAQLATFCSPRVDMIHWSAPRNSKDVHAPLTDLDAEQKNLYRHITESIPRSLDVIEVFDWEGVLASWDLLQDWRTQPRGRNGWFEQPEGTAASATDA